MSRTRLTSSFSALSRAALVGCVTLSFGCTALVSQIPPSNIADLEGIESREDREAAFEINQIVVHKRINGLRYTKGNDLNTPESDWQSLDLILRSDRVSAAALPDKKRRSANAMIGMAAVGGLATTAGIAATAGDGLDTTRMTAAGALLLGGAVVTVAFSVAAGVLYGKMRKDYQRAVEVYNASLSMRLGLSTADGAYRPPGEVLVDPDGFVVLTPSGSFVRSSNLDTYNAELKKQRDAADNKLAPDGTREAATETEEADGTAEAEEADATAETEEADGTAETRGTAKSAETEETAASAELAPEGSTEDASTSAPEDSAPGSPAGIDGGETPRDEAP